MTELGRIYDVRGRIRHRGGPGEPELHVLPGEVAVARAPAVLGTLLGSCVAVTVYDPVTRVGGLCHAMLPGGTAADGPLRYLDRALPFLLEAVADRGGSPGRLVFKAFGGAAVLGEEPTGAWDVGRRNVERLHELLGAWGVSLAGCDLGGRTGRRLRLHLDDGLVFVRAFGRTPLRQEAP